jgi:hypothetical protein
MIAIVMNEVLLLIVKLSLEWQRPASPRQVISYLGGAGKSRMLIVGV